ncbi:MAG: TIGR03960 family B12-binding radical SAM protein [Planctomycetes bacterium]|nr:TIGR03960 family B12-binding radical SAM protein [Planctomycetota bacterium]
MQKNEIHILQDRVEQDFLPFVRQPGRYIGGEVNQVKKDLTTCDVTVALCFPDVYEIAMSHTGIAVIYNIINSLQGAAAERVFAPWIDAEEILRKESIPLFSLESKADVSDFDIIAFSLNSELCCTNVLNMLDMSGQKLRSADRPENAPLIIAGGVSANCAEPVADFFDLIILGDGEEAILELIALFREHRDLSKKDFLLTAARQLDFVYVPSLYETTYDGDKITSFTATEEDIRTNIVNAIVKDFDKTPVPAAPIVPFVEAVHERVSVEIMRGCPGRCRFCQASFCKRPIRYRSVDTIVDIAKQNYHATGYDTVSLLSLSTADYPDLEELVEKLQAYFTPKHVGISLPSLRVKEQLQILPKLVSSVRKSGLTIAVEAAGEALRKTINKPITDEDLLAAALAAYQAGYQKVKLYFMVGFPGETEDDIRRIVDLSFTIAKIKRKVDHQTANVTVAISWLVPKAHTPFAWYGQKPREYFENAKDIILTEKRRRKANFLSFKFHGIDASILESATGRGDRRLGKVIETAWQKGARFDLWSECFDYNIWQEAFKETGSTPDQAAQRAFDPEDILPWQHLGGPEKQYLLDHYNKANESAKS